MDEDWTGDRDGTERDGMRAFFGGMLQIFAFAAWMQTRRQLDLKTHLERRCATKLMR